MTPKQEKQARAKQLKHRKAAESNAYTACVHAYRLTGPSRERLLNVLAGLGVDTMGVSLLNALNAYVEDVREAERTEIIADITRYGL